MRCLCRGRAAFQEFHGPLIAQYRRDREAARKAPCPALSRKPATDAPPRRPRAPFCGEGRRKGDKAVVGGSSSNVHRPSSPWRYLAPLLMSAASRIGADPRRGQVCGRSRTIRRTTACHLCRRPSPQNGARGRRGGASVRLSRKRRTWSLRAASRSRRYWAYERAVKFLEGRSTPAKGTSWYNPGDLLVQILMQEKAFDAAWATVKRWVHRWTWGRPSPSQRATYPREPWRSMASVSNVSPVPAAIRTTRLRRRSSAIGGAAKRCRTRQLYRGIQAAVRQTAKSHEAAGVTRCAAQR